VFITGNSYGFVGGLTGADTSTSNDNTTHLSLDRYP
jgi:hypothetical protein